MIYHKLVRHILTFLIILMVLSCGKEPVIKSSGKLSLSQLADKILFNSQETQDYQAALGYFKIASEDSLKGEETVLKGLSHIYQGEVYETAANMLSRMQLDLYFKSTDPEHGSKFPITDRYDDIKDKLKFWMGIDAYRVYGGTEGKRLLTSTKADPLFKYKQKAINTFSVNSGSYRDQTFLDIGEKLEGLNNLFPIFDKIIESERLFNHQEYEKVLSFLDDEELYNRNIFKGHKQVVYYSPAVLKLAALSHYKLGIKALENSFQKDFTTADSTGYKIIAILNLGQKYYYFEDSIKLSALWHEYENFLITHRTIVEILVETNEKMPYILDWIRFEDAIENVLDLSLPNELIMLDDSTDPTLEAMKRFIRDSNDSKIYKDIHYVLLDFKRNPEKMDNYPTLVSGFIKELNQSPLALLEKKQIQEVTESFVFNVTRSNSSWQRNRPAFLLSLFETLRWHGGRLPDCNGFLIDMRNMDERLNSLLEIASIFTQGLLHPNTNLRKKNGK